MQSSFFCVNVSLKMNMLGLEPQTPRFRVECATNYTTGHVQDTQLSFPVADIRSCSECWHCLLTHTADMYRYSDEAAVWHADRAPTIILFHRSVMLKLHSTQGYSIYSIASRLQYCFNIAFNQKWLRVCIVLFGYFDWDLLSSYRHG